MSINKLMILFLILTSCNSKNSTPKTEKSNSHQVSEKGITLKKERKKEKKKHLFVSYQSLNKANNAILDSLIENFPLSWERFGIEDEDTVTYQFCAANNPQFKLNENITNIRILIGNELNETFNISEVYYNDSLLIFNFSEKKMGLERCIIFIQGQNKQTAKFLIYDQNPTDSYSYLPTKILNNKKRIVYDCDTNE